MKKLVKILTILFLVFLAPNFSWAACDTPITCLTTITGCGFIESLGCLYISIISFSAIFALVKLVWAGILWSFGAEDPHRVDAAKTTIRNVFWGLTIALTSYILLHLIVGQF